MGSSSPYRSTLFAFCALFPSLIFSGPLSFNSIRPNFTASYLQYVDNSGPGAFLASRNNSFQARITNAEMESQAFYFVVIHVITNTIVWSANRNTPISKSSRVVLSNRGLVLYNDTGHPIWSTPQNLSSISSLQLLESGNLVLVDGSNDTVWESFDFPTDVILEGQKLNIGKSLVSSVKDEDLSEGDYRLVIGNSDAMLQWNGMNYWELSMETRGNIETNFPVAYMVMNITGVYLMGENGERIVIRVALNNNPNDALASSSNLRLLKLDHNGVLSVMNINGIDRSSNQEFKSPSDSCRIPYICKRFGVCTNGGSCQCAAAFHIDQRTNSGDCVPADNSLALPGSSCNGSLSNPVLIKYLDLGNDLDYFSNDFLDPVVRNVNLSTCENFCTRNCSCLGIFYRQNLGSCYMISNSLGSLFLKSSSTNRLGYVKLLVVGNPDPGSKKSDFPTIALVLLPSSGAILIAAIATLYWWGRRRRLAKNAKSKAFSSGEEEMDFVTIPGLPVRFEYKELAAATEDFKTRIGSGGFGTVYKGTLGDGSDVAVKKITCLGAQGRREFLTEIAVIGKIHHVNLVRLKGFCTYEGQRFLVYEYMNRGSLDCTLFRGDPVLEWNERYEIALGTARGLAYLHSGCEHKIIHCDVKPENILIHEKFQVKISDFGLSKLLTPEQSGLFTTMRGTRGYLAPEWLTSSAISDKTDVYSYGMVLLELMRGKKNSTAQSQSNSNSSGTDSNRGSSSSGESGNRAGYFPLYALQMHEEKRYMELVDPRLMGRVQIEEVEKLVRVALSCVHEEPNLRPSMTNVVGMLEGGMPLCDPRMESLNFLRFYGRRFTEASVMGENDGRNNEFMIHVEQTTRTMSSYNSLSYLSSQQVSGPR